MKLVRDHVLHLTYTAHDMAPFARDLGYDGPPFKWDEEERRHLLARLDALYFHLYGISREDAEYILGTFPIVQKEDEARFGCYRTSKLVLAYMKRSSSRGYEDKGFRIEPPRFTPTPDPESTPPPNKSDQSINPMNHSSDIPPKPHICS